jgi:hypothetical protein
LLAVWDQNLQTGEKLVINFPTKVHWRSPSQYDYIERGLDALKCLLSDKKIKGIAVPRLGCGNGGLDWVKVRQMIENKLGNLDLEVLVYEPHEATKEVIQKSEQ